MKVDDEVDEEEVKLWDTRCTGGRGLGRWSGMWEVPCNGLLWSIL